MDYLNEEDEVIWEVRSYDIWLNLQVFFKINTNKQGILIP